jgi:anti-sigma B factor antagonist
MAGPVKKRRTVGSAQKAAALAEVDFGTRLYRYGTVETLHVSGELDVATAPELERAVVSALDGQGGEFHLDLSALTFTDSSGANVLLHLHNRLESLGRHVVLLSPTRPVSAVFKVLGLDQVLDIRPSPNGNRGS